MIDQIFWFLGSLIYLELIELHFCQMDYNIKKNIIFRAESETYDDEDLFDDDERRSTLGKGEENERELRESLTPENIKTLN